MKRNIKYNIVAGWALALVAMFASYACTDKWDDHYDANSGTITDQTLWDVISSNSSLTQFTQILKLTGYDEILDNNRVYTVWAPADGTFNADSLKTLIAAGTTQKENVILDFVGASYWQKNLTSITVTRQPVSWIRRWRCSIKRLSSSPVPMLQTSPSKISL